ncbi:hypothetical protein ACH5RR_018963 [Cinchona calisaya]|uniref:F-box domain-containing protein n=1 Tax=Cinchona calisaya TaxID=153742 RepID=A0ABD2ZMY6_9GENT
MKKLKRIEGDDEWREFPEAIVQHILSFLSRDAAARMSLVSKTWYSAWTTYPILNLSLHDFRRALALGRNNNNNNNNIRDDEELVQQEFLNYVKKSLQRYSSHNNNALCVEQLHLSIRQIRCFSLPSSSSITSNYNFFFEKLLDIIETAGVVVKELRFFYTYEFGPSRYAAFPELFGILAAKAITECTIMGCKLEPLQIGEKQYCFSSLRRLSLEYVHMNEVVLETIILSCPLIESMKIAHCSGLERIRVNFNNIQNNSRLRKLDIITDSNTKAVEVQATNLQSFHCIATYSLSNFKLYRCENLKQLFLRDIKIKDSFIRDLDNNFPKLEDLSILEFYNFERINISARHDGVKIYSLSLSYDYADRFMQHIKEISKKLLVHKNSGVSLRIETKNRRQIAESIVTRIMKNIMGD